MFVDFRGRGRNNNWLPFIFVPESSNHNLGMSGQGIKPQHFSAQDDTPTN